jgi:hypothetical protein
MDVIPRYLSSTLESLSEKFQSEDFLLHGRHRSRLFTPRSLLLTLIQLVGSCAKEGYDHALIKVFGFDKAPRKSALSLFRNQLSYRFFEGIFTRTLDHFSKHRPQLDGLIIYAVDGWQFTLPRAESLVRAGFTGRATSKLKESYMPKGFITHAYEVLSETTKAFAVNTSQTELADALSFIGNFEKNSLTLYDRAYFSRALCLEHFKAGNYFLARCRSNANKKVEEFFDDQEKEAGSMYFDVNGEQKKVWLIKTFHSKTNEAIVFATNLPRQWRNPKTFDQLYQLRWAVETSFYELSETMKIQQWHSKSYNGVLQEIYTTMLVTNLVKILSFFIRGQSHVNPDKQTYKKPNFKLLKNHFIEFVTSFKPNLANLIHRFQVLIKRSTEKRKRRSRTHPRELRGPASPYPRNNTEWLWGKAHSLN